MLRKRPSKRRYASYIPDLGSAGLRARGTASTESRPASWLVPGFDRAGCKMVNRELVGFFGCVAILQDRPLAFLSVQGRCMFSLH